MRPKARGLTQHGGPPGWLEESDPAGCDFVRDGRPVPPAFFVPYRFRVGKNPGFLKKKPAQWVFLGFLGFFGFFLVFCLDESVF
jgi:hypothetical protein